MCNVKKVIVMNTKKLRRLITASILAGSLTFAPNIYNLPAVSVAYAETYEGVGDAIGSDDEPPAKAKLRAQKNAERNAVEQAGTYLISKSKAIATKIGYKLEEDEVITIASNIYKLKGQPFVEPIPLKGEAQGYTKYVVKVKIDIDTNSLNEEIRKWQQRNEKERLQLVTQNNALQKENDALKKRIAELEKNAANAKTAEAKAKVKSEFEQVDNDFKFNEKTAEGNKYAYNKNYEAASKSYADALKLKDFIIEGTGKYVMTSIDTEQIAMQLARENALQSAMGKIDLFLINYFKNRNKSITEGEILQIKETLYIVSEMFKPTMIKNKIIYEYKITFKFNDESVNKIMEIYNKQ